MPFLGLFVLFAVPNKPMLPPPKTVVKDPCLPGNHRTLNDSHRSMLHVPEKSDVYICDNNLKPDWYVFEKFQEMPTSCVSQLHCGTHHPIWLNGAHPTPAEGEVPRQACVNYGTPSSPISCCNTKIDIGVKNCGSYMVYKLKQAPSCPAAYCMGECVGFIHTGISLWFPTKDKGSINTPNMHIINIVRLKNSLSILVEITFYIYILGNVFRKWYPIFVVHHTLTCLFLKTHTICCVFIGSSTVCGVGKGSINCTGDTKYVIYSRYNFKIKI